MADQSGKVLIEVVLDDGQTKKFFDKLSKDAKSASDDVSKNAGGFSKVFSAEGASEFKAELSGAVAKIGVVAGAAAAAGLAIKKAFDLSLAGEQLTAAETVFDRIANSQGLTGLRSQLEDASSGLVDIGDILGDTSQAVLNLGGSAARLPEILKVATDSVRFFGGSAEERFLSLTRAIETGNTRLLRQQGIVIDADKVFKTYANSIGLTAGELNLAQKQQAILNAVIEEGQKRSAAGGASVAPLAEAFTRLSVAADDFVEGLQKSINAVIGPFFVSITNGIANIITGMNQAKSAMSSALESPAVSAADLRAQIISTEARIQSLQAKLQDVAKPTLNDWSPISQTKKLKDEIAQLQAQLPKLKSEFDKTGASISKSLGGGEDKPAAKVNAKAYQLTPEQLAAIGSRNAQIQTLQDAANAQFLATEATRISLSAEGDQKIFEQKMLLSQQLIQLGFERDQQLQAQEALFAQSGAFNEEQKQAARLAIITKYKDLAEQKTLESNARLLAAEQKFAEQNKQILKAGVVNTTVSAVESLGRSLQKGAMDWDDFGAAIAGTVGDMAISLGRGLIAQGLAMETFINAINSLLPGSGLAAAAAGVGLVLFGSALKASVGAGGGSGSSGGFQAGTPGGSPLITEPVTSTPINEQIEKSQPNTTVAVNISGSVYDSDETGLRIVDLLNSAFDKQGVVIKRGAIA